MATNKLKQGDQLADEEWLLRRVYRADKRYLDRNGRPTSRAFAPRPKDEGRLSVDIRRLTNFAAAVQNETKFQLFQFSADIPHQLGLRCLYDPIVGNGRPENMAHAVVTGFLPDDELIPGLLSRRAEAVTNF